MRVRIVGPALMGAALLFTASSCGDVQDGDTQIGESALLGDAIPGTNATTFADAKTILSGMGCGSVGALNCMAGMLLAAELNLQQGGNTCIQGVVDQANALLKKYNYSGFKPYSVTSADKTLSMQLHDLLSAYNIDGVPTC